MLRLKHLAPIRELAIDVLDLVHEGRLICDRHEFALMYFPETIDQTPDMPMGEPSDANPHAKNFTYSTVRGGFVAQRSRRRNAADIVSVAEMLRTQVRSPRQPVRVHCEQYADGVMIS